MMQLFGKILIASMFGILIHTSVFASDDPQITRYEQAKLRLTYEGSLGNLLQQLSQRLKVGFIAYDVDISHQVSIKNERETTIKTIYQQLEKQLPNIEIRFDKIGERLFLMVSEKGSKPLLTNVIVPEQILGDIIFEEEENTQGINLTNKEANLNAEHFQQIFSIATRKENLVAAKNKKSPQYKIMTQEKLGLQNIRVTPLGTFLIFDTRIDTTQLKVNGTFEDIAQNANMIAILHREKVAPTKIEIENAYRKKLILETPSTNMNQKSKSKK